MPYQVQQMIEGKGAPICVTSDDTVANALSQMIEHDFSQLPVIKKDRGSDNPEGLITYEGVLRGIRNFNAKLAELNVRDVMVNAPICSIEDDLFDVLDRLKVTNAVLVTDGQGPNLVGIVTSYDAAEYFRDRTEDLMRVEDVELMVKEFIRAAYPDDGDEVNKVKLNAAITKITGNANRAAGAAEQKKTFDDLSLGDYIALLVMKETWPFFEPVFRVQRDFARELLNGIRGIRNDLAHFRANITMEQRDRLKFGVEWLTRCRDEYQMKLESDTIGRLFRPPQKHEPVPEPATVQEPAVRYNTILDPQGETTEFSVTEATTSGGRLAALADWLQSIPGGIDRAQLKFSEVEQVIGTELPASARRHRAWWSNDSVGQVHSQQWLDAGWRSMYVNLNEGRVTFSRMLEREKAYIAFYNKLLNELRKISTVTTKDISPDGASWIVIWTLPRSGGSAGAFGISFSRDKRLRVELYLDLGDQGQTKTALDKLAANKEQIDAQVKGIEWERLDNRRASRLAVYHEGQIADQKKHAELRKWAAATMVKFYDVLVEPAEQAILEAKGR